MEFLTGSLRAFAVPCLAVVVALVVRLLLEGSVGKTSYGNVFLISALI